MRNRLITVVLAFVLLVLSGFSISAFGQCSSGNAVYFDGSPIGRYVHPLVPSNNIGDNFTIEFWAYPTGTIRGDLSAATSGIVGSAGQRYAVFPDWYGNTVQAGVGVSVGTNGVAVIEHAHQHMPATLVHYQAISGWTHFAIVYTNRTPSLYINSILVTPSNGSVQSTRAVYPSSNVGNFIVGGFVFQTYGPYMGYLDEFRIWGGYFSQATIAEWYNKELNPTHPYWNSLERYWNFNEASGIHAWDASGHSRYGTFVNGVGRDIPSAAFHNYTFYADMDGDGFGDPGNSITGCSSTAQAPYIIDNTDCDDTNPQTYPGAPVTLTCPSNITVDVPVGQCGATVNFAPPTGNTSCNNFQNVSRIFNYSGAAEDFNVPVGVSAIHVKTYGASGGPLVNKGGLGGFAEGDLSVTPGQILKIFVGEIGGTNMCGPINFNGGGRGLGGYGGGGASDVRTAPYNLTNRKIIAGGGGGQWQFTFATYIAGNGGGLIGGNGATGLSPTTGGTQTSAGLYGTGAGFGLGGNATPGCIGGATGCGGGGGWYGGGATNHTASITGNGAGAGGSSYLGGVTNGVTTAGLNLGHGKVEFEWQQTVTPVITQTSGLPSGSVFPVGTTTNTFRLVYGTEEYTCSFTVIVNDVEKPTVVTRNVTIQLDQNGQASITPAQINNGSTDNCAIAANGYSLNKSTFTCSDLGQNTVTLTVTDVNGNAESGTAIVTVEDRIPPSLVKGVIAPCYTTAFAAESAAIQATLRSDNCTQVLNVQAATVGNCIAIITVTVRDGSNNASSVSYNTRIDATPPNFINPPTNMTVNCNVVVPVPNVISIDNCTSSALTVVFQETSTKGNDPLNPNYYNYVITRRWTTADACGHTATHPQIITVQDTEAPTVSTAAGSLDSEVACDDPAALTSALALFPAATDNCATPVIHLVSDEVIPGCGTNYTRKRVWNFSDPSGNVSLNFMQTITVTDPSAPSISTVSGALDRTVECSDGAGIAASLVLAPEANDNCSTPVIHLVSDNTVNGCGSTYVRIRTWNFTDACGNTSETFTQTITVNNSIAPLISSNANSVEHCYNGVEASYSVPVLAATANCGVVTYSYLVKNSAGVTIRTGNTNNASGSFDVGINTIYWTVTDECNNYISATTLVRINQQITGSFNEVLVLPSGALPNTLYVGYVPANTTDIKLTASGGTPFSPPNNYSYIWSASNTAATYQVDAADNSIIHITGASEGQTVFTVKVKDSKGCEETFTKTISVTDVRCGNNLNKVVVCQVPPGNPQNVHTNCVSPNAVATLLAGGDYLGSCAVSNPITSRQSNEQVTINTEEFSIRVMPNPSQNYFSIIFNSERQEKIVLRVSNILGQIVDVKDNIAPGSTLIIGSDYAPGFYIAELRQGKIIKTVKLIKRPPL